jgi:hypothetical protein
MNWNALQKNLDTQILQRKTKFSSAGEFVVHRIAFSPDVIETLVLCAKFLSRNLKDV